MAQSGSAHSSSFSTVSSTDRLIVPVGENLGNSSTRTKVPSPGALAYDSLTDRLYYGDSSDWILIDNSLGDGDVIGDTTSVDGTLVTYNGTDGKHIKNVSTIVATGGYLLGVTGINGVPIGNFGDVFGPNSSVTNTLATYNGVSGKIIQDGTTITAIGGQIAGVTGINGVPIGNFGDVFGPVSSVTNTLATYNGVSGKIIQDGTTITAIGGQLAGVTGINGIPIGTFGDVFGPGSSVSGHVVGFTGTDGKHIYDTGFVITGSNTGDVTLTAFGAVPNSNAASLTGQALTLQPANLTNPGGVSTAAQTFGGAKTFTNGTLFGGLSTVGSNLNAYKTAIISMNIFHGATLLLNENFVFLRIGNACTVFMQQFIFPRGSFPGDQQTFAVPVTASDLTDFVPTSTAVLGYGNMTTLYSARPSAGSRQDWVGYLRVIFTGGQWQLNVNPEFDTTSGLYPNFADLPTGNSNGWQNQSVTYLITG